MLSGCYFCTSRVTALVLQPSHFAASFRETTWQTLLDTSDQCVWCVCVCVLRHATQFLQHRYLFFFFSVSQGLHDQALEDCEKALQLNEGNYKALYRKAKSLKEMGRHQEAYEAVAECSLAVPQVSCTNLYKSLSEFHLNEFNKPKIPVQMLPRKQTTHPVESCWFWIVAWCVGLRAG